MRTVISKLKKLGMRNTARLVVGRIFPGRLKGYREFLEELRGKVGLEIGGPSGAFKRSGRIPVYSVAKRIDNCNFSRTTVWEGSIAPGATFRYDKRRPAGIQYISEATDLSEIPASSYDFVLSAHTLEHTANPLKALGEWRRVLKSGGLMVLAVPHRDGTFDHRRDVTDLDHIVADLERGTQEDDLAHLDEIVAKHDLAMDPGCDSLAFFKERSLKNFENRCLHHHVFDARLVANVVDRGNLQILTVQAFKPCDIFVVARKPDDHEQALNPGLKDLHSLPNFQSPFPSDR